MADHEPHQRTQHEKQVAGSYDKLALEHQGLLLLDALMATAVGVTYFYFNIKRIHFIHPPMTLTRRGGSYIVLFLLRVTFPYIIFWAAISRRIVDGFWSFIVIAALLVLSSIGMVLWVSGIFSEMPSFGQLATVSLVQALLFTFALHKYCSRV